MSTDSLSRTLSALAHPARREILARLRSGQASVQELAVPFDVSAAAVSKHLKVLENSGLIRRGKDAQWRPCELEAAPLQEVAQWIELFRKEWEDRFDRLEAYLAQQLNPPK